jgi:hypothetical protein
MLIKYQPEYDHIKCVPLVHSLNEPDELKKIILTRPQVQLLPGVNEVTDDEWKIMKPHLAAELKSKVISIVEKEVQKSKRAPDGKAKNLKEMPADEAIELVSKCVNPDTLKKWYREETREEVRLSIVEMMKELKVDLPKFKGGKAAGGQGAEGGDDTGNGKGPEGAAGGQGAEGGNK